MTDMRRSLQVVEVLEDSYQLDEELLKQVLLREDVRNLPVVVVSVAGAFRGGKSFLLNFFIRYLSSPQRAREDGSWLGKDRAPLVGFSWRGGSKRDTTGILLWSEPFIQTLPTGEKVAVILMDTQGTFDHSSTTRDNSTIFALSTLLSSVQIYNIPQNIKEDDLQHLQLFTMYGKMAQENEHQGKVFQILEFLVRDWQFPEEYPYGAKGGKSLLQEKLEISPNQGKELKELRTHIRSCFEEVLCFLMPHPGFMVLKPTFRGSISGVEQEFQKHLKDLVSSLLSAEKLCPKIINGQKVKTGELFNYFKAYMTLFNSDQVPQPRNIIQATAEASLLSSMIETREEYEKGMDAEFGPTKPGVAQDYVFDLHNKHLTAAREAFTKKRTMATKEAVNKFLDKLNTELGLRLPHFEQRNVSKLQLAISQAKEVYEQKIRDVTVSNNQSLCLHPMDLDVVHNEAVQAAINVYDERVKKSDAKPDTKRAELKKSIENLLPLLKTTNDISNRDAVKNIHTDYCLFMGTKSVEPPISDAEFKISHDTGLSEALAKFQTRRNRTNNYPNDVYKEELIKTINNTFSTLKEINLRKIEQKKQSIELNKMKTEMDRIREEQDKTAKDQKTAQEKIEKELTNLSSLRKEQEEMAKQQYRLHEEREEMARLQCRLSVQQEQVRQDCFRAQQQQRDQDWLQTEREEIARQQYMLSAQQEQIKKDGLRAQQAVVTPKNNNCAVANSQSFSCNICGRICGSRIGLYSHTQKCEREQRERQQDSFRAERVPEPRVRAYAQQTSAPRRTYNNDANSQSFSCHLCGRICGSRIGLYSHTQKCQREY